MLNFTASKTPQKKTNNVEASLATVNSGIQLNTNGLLSVFRISSTIFRMLEWPLLYTHCIAAAKILCGYDETDCLWFKVLLRLSQLMQQFGLLMYN